MTPINGRRKHRSTDDYSHHFIIRGGDTETTSAFSDNIVACFDDCIKTSSFHMQYPFDIYTKHRLLVFGVWHDSFAFPRLHTLKPHILEEFDIDYIQE